MLRNTARFLLILFIAGIVSLGWYTVSITDASDLLLGDMAQGRPERPEGASSEKGEFAPTDGGAARHHEGDGGISLSAAWPGFLKHTIILTAITLIVLLIRKLTSLFSRKNNRNDSINGSDKPNTEAPDAKKLDRRQFLHLGGLAVATGATLAGYKTLFGTDAQTANAQAIASSQNANTTTDTVDTVSTQQTCIACPKGISYDPYPGKCRLYIDNDGDGMCDYSIPGPCSENTTAANVQSYGRGGNRGGKRGGFH